MRFMHQNKIVVPSKEPRSLALPDDIQILFVDRLRDSQANDYLVLLYQLKCGDSALATVGTLTAFFTIDVNQKFCIGVKWFDSPGH